MDKKTNKWLKEKVNIDQNRRKYMIPSGAAYQQPTKNVIYISSANSVRHELAKALGGYMLNKWGDIKFDASIVMWLKQLDRHVEALMSEMSRVKESFITEAVPKSDRDRRIDLVRLSDEQWIEYETQLKVEKKNCFTVRL